MGVTRMIMIPRWAQARMSNVDCMLHQLAFGVALKS